MAACGGPVLNSPSTEFALERALRSIDGAIESKIAQTSHCTVYRAKSSLYGRAVAVKIINVNALPKPVADKFLPRELLFTRLARHPHIGRALSIRTPHPTKIAIISEYYNGGTLLEFILRHKRIPEYPHGCRLFRQLAEAVNYLHIRSVVHRDIKAENVLLDSNGDVKLIDFGFARYIDRKERSTSFCGTRPYSAPEIVNHQPYDAYATDWYAMGVLLYTMLTGKWPHSPHDKIKKDLRHLIFSSKNTPSRPARALILCLMNEDCRFRGTYDTIVHSDWMKCQSKWLMADQNFIYEVIETF